MNPYGETRLSPGPGPVQSSAPGHYNSHDASLPAASPPVISTGHSSVNSEHSTSTQNPYPASCQVSIVVPVPDPIRSQDAVLNPDQVRVPNPDPDQVRCSEDPYPDLECAVCFSQFNNMFRCPKMLRCRHTFCLECLARINVKAAEPAAIQCPLCRGFTPLPALGLTKLDTDRDVLSFLPAAMQRVYSIRFHRSKGKLQVKSSSEGQRRSLASLRSMNRSLDVGLPSPPVRGEAGRVGGVLFRLTGRPACRAFLFTSVVMMMMLLTGIIIFLLAFPKAEP